MENLIPLLKALGDDTRLRILLILSKRDICAKGLSKHLGITPSSVSQHIKVLKDTGLIVGEKEGYFVRYHLNTACFEPLKTFIHAMECHDVFEHSPYQALVNLECASQCTKKSMTGCCQSQNERTS